MRTRDYVYAISTDSLSAAITEAEEILSDLLEESLRSDSGSETQATIELQRALGRHREQRRPETNIDVFDPDADDEGEVELVE